MRSKVTIAALGLAAAALALPAAAQMSMSSGYVGGSLGQSKFKADCGPFSCDKNDTSFRLFGGYQFTRNIAAELGYTDLGKLKVSGFGLSGEVKATAWDLSGVFSWPFANQFAVCSRRPTGSNSRIELRVQSMRTTWKSAGSASEKLVAPVHTIRRSSMPSTQNANRSVVPSRRYSEANHRDVS